MPSPHLSRHVQRHSSSDPLISADCSLSATSLGLRLLPHAAIKLPDLTRLNLSKPTSASGLRLKMVKRSSPVHILRSSTIPKSSCTRPLNPPTPAASLAPGPGPPASPLPPSTPSQRSSAASPLPPLVPSRTCLNLHSSSRPPCLSSSLSFKARAV